MLGQALKPEGYRLTMTGRPTDFKQEFCEMLVDHMNEGLSYESFAGLVGVCRATIYNWEKIHPEFLDAKKRGHAKMTLTLERIGMKGMMGEIKGFNASTFIFTAKNKIAWSDVSHIDQTNTNIQINLDPEDVKV